MKLLIDKIVSVYFSSIFRHFLTFLGGTFVSLGIITADQSGQFVAVNSEILIGLAAYAIGQAWSFYNARK